MASDVLTICPALQKMGITYSSLYLTVEEVDLMNTTKIILYVLAIIVIIITFFVLNNVLTLILQGRQKYMARLKILGASSAMVAIIYYTTLILSFLVAFILAVALSSLFCGYFTTVANSLLSFESAIVLRWEAVVVLFCIGLVFLSIFYLLFYRKMKKISPLSYLGITNLQAALGKEIQIENGELKFEGTICGILNRQLIEDQNFLECFVAYKSEDCNISDDYCYISLTTFKNSNKLVSFIESILTDDSDYFWFGTNIEEIMAIIESQKELCNSFLSFLSLIIVLVICIYISSNQFYLLQKNSLFYGILKAHGVNNKGVFWVFFLELFLMCILAELFAILLSIGIFSAIKSIISEVFFIDLGLPLNVVAWSVPVFLALGLFLSLSITFFVYYILIIQ